MRFATVCLLAVALASCGKSTARSKPRVETPPPAKGPLRWTGIEGFTPIGEDVAAFNAVTEPSQVASVLATKKQAAFSVQPGDVCRVMSVLRENRERVSLDIGLGTLDSPAVECVADIRPAALSYTRIKPLDPLSSDEKALLSHLEGCEAFGVRGAGDEVALFLGDRVEAPDGAWLRTLNLTSARLSEEAFRAIAKWKKLRALGLRRIAADRPDRRAAIAVLATLPDLERIDLSQGKFDDAALAAFGDAKRLEQVDIDAPEVTDAGFEALARAPALKTVRFGRRITEEAVGRFRAQRPGVELVRTSARTDP